jgi:hypothetical protein
MINVSKNEGLSNRNGIEASWFVDGKWNEYSSCYQLQSRHYRSPYLVILIPKAAEKVVTT